MLPCIRIGVLTLCPGFWKFVKVFPGGSKIINLPCGLSSSLFSLHARTRDTVGLLYTLTINMHGRRYRESVCVRVCVSVSVLWEAGEYVEEGHSS
jgi:hypothetical protein